MKNDTRPMNEARTSEKYNKLVARKDDEYYFLEEIFSYGNSKDSLKGATGHALRPISKEEYDERTDPDTLRDYLSDHWQEAVHSGQTELGLDDWVEMVINTDGAEETAFDTSGWYGEEWDQLRKLGMTEEEYPVFEWSTAGRCFDKATKYDEVYDQKLLDKIRKIEA